MGWRPSSSVVCRASCVNIFFSRSTWPILTKFICSICRVRRQEILNLKPLPHPKGRSFWGKKCRIGVFLKNLLLYSGVWFRQTKCIVMMTKEGSTEIVNFMTLRAGVLMQGRGHISHIVKMYYSFKNLLLYFQA